MEYGYNVMAVAFKGIILTFEPTNTLKCIKSNSFQTEKKKV